MQLLSFFYLSHDDTFVWCDKENAMSALALHSLIINKFIQEP